MVAMCLRVAMVLALANVAFGDVVLQFGTPFGFPAPDPPYSPQDSRFEITIGYGEASNTIGSGLWHSGPGTWDLANDPGFDEFSVLATNGTADRLTVTVTDVNGQQWVEPFFHEGDLFSRPVDLSPLEITSIQLVVLGIATVEFEGAWYTHIAVRYDALGVPEPTTALLMALGGMFCRPHARPCATWKETEDVL